jgi:hypothetical protein
MGTAHNRASISLAAQEQGQNDRILTGVVWEQLKRQLEVATQGRLPPKLPPLLDMQ